VSVTASIAGRVVAGRVPATVGRPGVPAAACGFGAAGAGAAGPAVSELVSDSAASSPDFFARTSQDCGERILWIEAIRLRGRR
jgi:outer membrane lipoprotein SlyB